MPTYTFATGVPNIVPAVYATSDTGETTDLNADDTATASSGVLSLELDTGDYQAKWRWEGDTHYASGEVANPAGVQSLGEVSTGGSSHGDPCWFGNQSGQALTADVTYRVPWTDLLDGVPAATDLRPDADTLKCVTPGLYMVSVTLMVNALDGSGVTGAFSIMDYNDDSAGPLYYLEPIEVVKDIADPAGTQYRHIYPPAPIELAVDDILWAEVNALGGNAALGGCYFHATRLG